MKKKKSPTKAAKEAKGDKNVEAVRKKLSIRAALGLKKYGVTTERGDLTELQWLQHLQDELLDGAVYLEKLMEIERAKIEN